MISEQDKQIKLDRMRFSQNKLSANLALVAIVFNVLYFVSVYRTNASFYYQYLIGISVLTNLVFMLVAFLSSEGVKQYKMSYAIALIVLGVVEVVRIFILPVLAHTPVSSVDSHGEEIFVIAMEDKQFARVIVYLSLTALTLFTAGIIGIIRSKKLSDYKQSLEQQQA